MKKTMIFAFLCMPVLLAAEQAPAAVSPEAKGADAAQAQVMDVAERNKMLYSLGFLLGDNLKKQLILLFQITNIQQKELQCLMKITKVILISYIISRCMIKQ